MGRDTLADPAAYQPAKAGMEAVVSIDATPKALGWAVTRGGEERKEPEPVEGATSARVA